MHLQPTHTHILHSASSQIPVWNPVGGLWWGFIAETVYVSRSLAVLQRNSIVDVWRNSKCDSVFGEGFHHWGYTGESWTPPASWFSWFKPNANTRRWNLGLNPRPHFLEGEFIHLVDKAKNVWLIVGQLPRKAGWWNTSLALRDFSRSCKHKDSPEESSWFPAFPLWFPAFPPWFPAFPPWFPSFRSPIPHSSFYR